MEVDHFDPHRKRDLIQDYDNLFPASRHCNGAKRDQWPSFKERKSGLRFLNCCREMDYGEHIFEDPDTHEVVGITLAGRYHVRACDLNAEHLIEERAERARIWARLKRPLKLKKGWTGWEAPEPAVLLKRTAETLIPPIPYLTGALLEERRKRRKLLAQMREEEGSIAVTNLRGPVPRIIHLV